VKHLKVAYSKMLRDRRLKARVAVMSSLTAYGDGGKAIALTVTDIGHKGVGVCAKETLAINDVLAFSLSLPNIEKALDIQMRVLWTRSYGAAGGEIIDLSQENAAILADWLTANRRLSQREYCN
jgi:hypothetical protein